jgi:hypothetical protein
LRRRSDNGFDEVLPHSTQDHLREFGVVAADLDAAVASVIEQTPLGRLGEVSDIADALCSNEARFITVPACRRTAAWVCKSQAA